MAYSGHLFDYRYTITGHLFEKNWLVYFGNLIRSEFFSSFQHEALGLIKVLPFVFAGAVAALGAGGRAP